MVQDSKIFSPRPPLAAYFPETLLTWLFCIVIHENSSDLGHFILTPGSKKSPFRVLLPTPNTNPSPATYRHSWAPVLSSRIAFVKKRKSAGAATQS